jgi:hypothetical protein
MKKLYLGAGLVLGSLLLGGPASAVIGTIDAVPAATLLLPYFEVDIANPNGMNTMFWINNASNVAVLAHVTVWTDQSVPAIDFDVYLTGYDMEKISLRDIFVNGNLPRTAPAGQDPTDTISPKGTLSQDFSFASCSSLPYAPGAVSASFRAHLQAWFQGNPSPATGNCAGSKQPDTNVLRGYVTVDTVNACNLFFPSDWAFYDTYVTDQNVLWGNVVYVDPSRNLAQGDTLVHIEACPTCFAPGNHTFYGRYSGASAADAREPLPTKMAALYENGSSTDFLVWREADESDTAYNCALQGPPTWYPLGFLEVLIFDEKETMVNAEECWWGDPTCTPTVRIPNEANRINVASGLLAPYASGWMQLNLQHNEVNPIYGDPHAQMWLTTVTESGGQYSVGFPAIQLDNANQ